MNEGMYTNIRNYLEEIASQNKQILVELKRTNELLGTQATGKTETKPLAKATATKAEATDAVGPVTVETVKAEPLKTTETVEVKPATQPAAKKGK